MEGAFTRAFTIDYFGKVNKLHTECGVCKHFDPRTSKEKHPKIENFNGLWDTGATNSAISRNVIDKLGLIPTGMGRVFHAGGESWVSTYYVNIFLPNKAGIHSLRVTEGKINGADVLIGMDIISRGDFAVCHRDGKTKFSFQIPSSHDFDFVKEYNEKYHTPAKAGNLPGRNDPCHCGSGIKYKNCHGKDK
jgi:predicted aspartyl protease